MPNKCCVPECTSNRKTNTYVPLFSFPRQGPLRSLWLRKISKENLVIGKNTRVCIKHFKPEFVVRNHEAVRNDGSKVSIPRDRLTLKKDAYPSIFPDASDYRSERPMSSPIKCESPSECTVSPYNFEVVSYEECAISDEFKNFADFMWKIDAEKITSKDWIINPKQSYIYLFKINCNGMIPMLVKTIILDSNFAVKVIVKDQQLDIQKFKYILGPEVLCNSCTKLEKLLKVLHNFKDSNVTLLEVAENVTLSVNAYINGIHTFSKPKN